MIKTNFFKYFLQLHILKRFDVLNVELLPNARLKRAGNVVEIPAESQTLGHPKLIRLGQLLPVPANLSAAAQAARIQEGHYVEADYAW